MLSYRTQLAKIGITPGTPWRYRDFAAYPSQLSVAMRSMDWPKTIAQATEGAGEIDEGWTEECQGVAWDGEHWIFSSNGSGVADAEFPLVVGHMPKALYLFNGNTNFSDDAIVQRIDIANVIPLSATNSINPVIPEPEGGIYHIGPVIFHDNMLYIDHWNNYGSHILRFRKSGGSWHYLDWIAIEPVDKQRMGLVAINLWDGTFFMSHGAQGVTQLHIHRLDGQKAVYTKRSLTLDPPITDGGYVQGGAFSPNGHLYVASGRSNLKPYQYIYGYSPLNGRRISTISVLSKDDNQELEGICYAGMTRNGHNVQLHAVLLDNITMARDNIFLKSFAASEPHLV